MEDGEIIETTKGTIKVLLDVDCRVSLEEVMKPLQEDGIESVELRKPDDAEDKEPLVRIPKADAAVFKAPPAEDSDESPIEREAESLVSIVSINFQNGKWRFSDGSAVFWAAMEDEAFNRKVEKGGGIFHERRHAARETSHSPVRQGWKAGKRIHGHQSLGTA